MDPSTEWASWIHCVAGRGRPASRLRVNWPRRGILATFAGLAAVLRMAIGLVTQRWLDVRFVCPPILRRVLVGIGILLLIALEVRQQGRAELLMRPY